MRRLVFVIVGFAFSLPACSDLQQAEAAGDGSSGSGDRPATGGGDDGNTSATKPGTGGADGGSTGSPAVDDGRPMTGATTRGEGTTTRGGGTTTEADEGSTGSAGESSSSGAPVDPTRSSTGRESVGESVGESTDDPGSSDSDGEVLMCSGLGMCSEANAAACVCEGCNPPNGNCNANEDCVCPDCTGANECICNSNGICNPWEEDCTCVDCAAHPMCQD